jgi:outer membrane lipoprotein-sorting protein
MKLFALTALAGAGLILCAALTPPSLIEKQAAVLKDAKTLKVTYVLRVGGVKSDYTLTYSKPNLMLVDGPDRLIESDGTTFWEYNKAAKTYTESPASADLLGTKAQGDEVLAWASFFTEDFVKGMSNIQTGGARPIKGQPTTEVSFTLGSTNTKVVTLYIDDKLGFARGFTFKGSSGDVIGLADKIETGSEAMSADKFTFAAPAGATKVVAPSSDVNGTGFASVRGIFQNNCSGCHNDVNPRSGFSVGSYQSVMKGGNNGPAIVPGDPDNSSLVKYLTGDMQPRMPQGKGPLSPDDIGKIKAWIKAGAKE